MIKSLRALCFPDGRGYIVRGGLSVSEPIESRIFRVRRTIGKAYLFFIAFGVILVAGIVIQRASDPVAGLWVILFGAVGLAGMVLMVLSPGSQYRLGASGLELRRAFSKRLLPLESIRGARVIDAQEAGEILKEYLSPVIASEALSDLKGWLKSSRKYGGVVRYCTVPIVQSRATSGSFRNGGRYGGKTSGKLRILRRDDGEEILLSPAEPEELLRQLSARTALPDPVASPHAYRSAGVDREASVRRWKTLSKISLITFAVLAIAVLAYYFVSRARATAAETVPASSPEVSSREPGWGDESSYRVVFQTSSAAVPLLPEADDRAKELRRAVDATYPFEIVGTLINEYLVANALEIDAATHQAAYERLSRYIGGLQAVVVDTELDEEVTAIRAVVEVSGSGLKSTVNSLIAEVVGARD